ncbi:winged helix-turn-helix domain-containing protein [Streptomyces sp. NPDC051658]|uniref:winged helix-turn-helix domain-containing protein n=1 Tax=Streptomyces sp. NPDC051658 TaxID=3365667 RepID=UPI0037B9503A
MALRLRVAVYAVLMSGSGTGRGARQVQSLPRGKSGPVGTRLRWTRFQKFLRSLVESANGSGWSWQQPARRAIERDDGAVELWKKEVWPQVKVRRRPAGPGSSVRTRQASR